MRFGFVARAYGWREGLRALPRTVTANIIAIMAARRALGRYLRLRRTGRRRGTRPPTPSRASSRPNEQRRRSASCALVLGGWICIRAAMLRPAWWAEPARAAAAAAAARAGSRPRRSRGPAEIAAATAAEASACRA